MNLEEAAVILKGIHSNDSFEIGAAVAVLEAHDVVFAEVLPALHLNQLDGDFSGIAEPVFATQGDVGALVLTQQLLFAVTFDDRCSAHHDPVLSPVVVHLQ